MIVYEATKKQFLQDSDNDDIEEVILQHFKAVTGKSVGNSEINSWKGSLGYMAKVLRDEEVPDDTGLAIELHCSGQPIPDSGLSFSSATAGGSPSLN